MKQSVILFLLIMFVWCGVQAQEREVFKELTLRPPTTDYKNAGYRSVRVIDMRSDTVRCGKIKLGMMNRAATVVFKPSLAQQLTAMIPNSADSAWTKELVLLINNLEFMEGSSGYSEKGIMVFEGALYEKDSLQYYLIQPISKEIQLLKTDVTQELLQLGCDYFTSLLPEFAHKTSNRDNPLTYIELVKADSLAKRKIKAYNTDSIPNGVYSTYQAFKELKPDYQAKVVRKKMKIKSVTVPGSDGLPKEVFRGKVFVLVTDGIPFISTFKGYYPLRFKEDEYTFVGKVHLDATQSQKSSASAMLGLLGYMMVQGGSDVYYLTKINYKDGSFINLQEIPFGEEDYF